MVNVFLTPGKIVSGKDVLAEVGPLLKNLGNKALIVTDTVMVSTGNVQKLINVLKEQNIPYELFAEINSEPTDNMVYQGLAAYDNAKCDFLIGIGGGSPIDAAKAIGAVKVHGGKLADYMGKELRKPLPALVAIPTTAGTGSEATQFTIIADTKNDVKMLLKGAVLLPALAVIDPDLTATTPPKVTAATGIDALTHAVEAYTSIKAQPLSDIFAISACKRIFANLRKAYRDGADMTARNEMALASLEAGIAFNNSSVTLVHGMSRPIGALFHVPHGISNAMLLVECLRFAVHGATGRFADIARAIGACQPGASDQDAAKALVQEIDKLCQDLDIPTLENYGVDRKAFFKHVEKMADDALVSGSPNNTRRKASKEEIITIYTALWQ